MTCSRTLLFFVLFLVCNNLFGQDPQHTPSTIIYDFNDKAELKNYNSLKLDESYPNLLNPEVSGDELDNVIQSWSELHQEIGRFLKEKEFKWNVDDAEINIVQKIYFTPNGEIRHYFFRVLNGNVSSDTRDEFVALLSEFSSTHEIELTRDKPFAQCGKTRYIND